MRFAIAILILVGAACAPRDAGFSVARTTFHERLDLEVERRDPSDPGVSPEARRLLAEPLTAARAVEVALLENRSLQAAFEELGLARAALVDAGLLPNPELHVEIGIAESGEPRPAEIEGSIDVRALLLRRARRGVADAELEAANLVAAARALDLVLEVRTAFIDCQAAQRGLTLRRSILAAAELSYEAMQQVHEAGNAPDLALANERASLEEARLSVAESEGALLDSREALNVALGLWGDAVEWSVADDLATPPPEPIDLSGVERRAVAASVDLEASRAGIEASARRLGVVRTSAALPSLHAGVTAEREGGDWHLLPGFGVELPILSQGQGMTAAAHAELARRRQAHLALAVQVRAAARSARNHVRLSRQRALYLERVIVPLRERILEETQLRYNGMFASVFELLTARQAVIDARRRHVDALRDYWRARARLDTVLAGRMVVPGGRMSPAAAEISMDADAGGH